MSKRSKLTAVLSAGGLFLIILDGKTALSAATEGIELCLRSVIPALFPFFVLSNLLTGTVLGTEIAFLNSLCRWLRVPKGAESLVVTGFLGGYPVGAQCVANAWRKGQLSKTDAERMLSFCNNPGPSFLFGILGPILSANHAWLLWAILILSGATVSLLIPAEPGTMRKQYRKQISLSESVQQSVRVMATVCGWIVLFRICIGFWDRWILWALPLPCRVAVMGFLELTNGCLELSTISNEGLRFILCAAMLGFGGICVTMQTVSVTQGLDLRLYFHGKCLQSAISTVFSCLLFPGYPLIFCVALAITAISVLSLAKTEKRSGNPSAIGV